MPNPIGARKIPRPIEGAPVSKRHRGPIPRERKRESPRNRGARLSEPQEKVEITDEVVRAGPRFVVLGKSNCRRGWGRRLAKKFAQRREFVLRLNRSDVGDVIGATERCAARVMPQILMQLMRQNGISTTMKFYVGSEAKTTVDVLWDAMKKPELGTNPGTIRKKTKLGN